MALSDTWLRANYNKEIPKPIEKTDRDGMSVRVTTKGKITFQMRFYLDGKQCRLDLGRYPLISLKQARELLIKYKAEVEKGHDPRIVKKLSKQANIEAITVKDLYEQWHKSYCEKNKKGHFEIKRSFEIHLFPVLGNMPVDKITTPVWCNAFEKVLKNSESIANRLIINSKQMLSWAVRRGLIENNALLAITPKADFNISQHSTNRVLSDDEIKMIWLMMSESRIAVKNALFVKLCLIYGCRNGELRLAKKSDFDFDSMVWTVPPENHKSGKKSGKAIVRPITKEIEPMLRLMFALSKNEWLLDNLGTKEPMSGNASVSIPYNIMQWLRKNKDYDMKHWSMHDLRRTARTNFSSLTQPHIAEICLGHVPSGTWGTYDLHHYLDEQRALYDAWIKRLKGLVHAL